MTLAAAHWVGRKAHIDQLPATTDDACYRALDWLHQAGFADQEYWNHCATGGHPAPKRARLLEKLDPARQSWPYSAAELLVDLGPHLQRTWRALDTLLARHHARYAKVQADERRQAEVAWSQWQQADPVMEALTQAWSGS